MSEADYILVSTLTRVRAAIDALGEVIATNDATTKAIPPKERQTVGRLMVGWRERLESMVKARRDECAVE